LLTNEGPYFSEPGPDELNVVLCVDPEDEEVSRIQFLVDQLTEGADLGKLGPYSQNFIFFLTFE
jgi:hypothetical protein